MSLLPDAPTSKATRKFLSRRYWVYLTDRAELKYGVSSLTFTANSLEKALKYLHGSPHDRNFLLDTKTGQYYAMTAQRTFIPLDLSAILKRNQEEFYKLKARV